MDKQTRQNLNQVLEPLRNIEEPKTHNQKIMKYAHDSGKVLRPMDIAKVLNMKQPTVRRCVAELTKAGYMSKLKGGYGVLAVNYEAYLKSKSEGAIR